MSGSCEDTYGGDGVVVCIIKINSQLNRGISMCILDSRLGVQRNFSGNRQGEYVDK